MSLKGCLKQGHVSEAGVALLFARVCVVLRFLRLCCLFALCCVLFDTIYDTHVKDTLQGP